jgi:hypothetical protein
MATMMHGVSNLTPVFGYGSNSATQLRARVETSDLLTFPASLRGWQRVFCLTALGWGDGGVASLVEVDDDDATVYGSLAFLTDSQLLLLDKYERGYEFKTVQAEYLPTKGASPIVLTNAKAYIVDNPIYTVPPSEQYLTAIYIQLSESWDMSEQSITVNKCIVDKNRNGSVNGNGKCMIVKIYEWYHPFACLPKQPISSLSLEALIVASNQYRPPDMLLIMPKSISIIIKQLKLSGITSCAMLINRLRQTVTVESTSLIHQVVVSESESESVSVSESVSESESVQETVVRSKDIAEPNLLDSLQLSIFKDILFPK